jgi:hypothetical protein
MVSAHQRSERTTVALAFDECLRTSIGNRLRRQVEYTAQAVVIDESDGASEAGVYSADQHACSLGRAETSRAGVVVVMLAP